MRQEPVLKGIYQSALDKERNFAGCLKRTGRFDKKISGSVMKPKYGYFSHSLETETSRNKAIKVSPSYTSVLVCVSASLFSFQQDQLSLPHSSHRRHGRPSNSLIRILTVSLNLSGSRFQISGDKGLTSAVQILVLINWSKEQRP